MTTTPDTNALDGLAANIRQELHTDTPQQVAGNRSLTTTQLAYLLNENGHTQLAQQILR
jgi:hypothetical protein